MELNAYPNLAALGNIKQTKLNKKMYAQMEENLARISPEELRLIDAQIPQAIKLQDFLLTPTAVIQLDKMWHVLNIILLKDIVYIWGSTQTMTMCLIPYQKLHDVSILSRHGYRMTTEQISTGGFSKKDVCGNIIAQIKAVAEPQYPGILYGWSKEREQAMCNDFSALVAAVDQARASAN